MSHQFKPGEPDDRPQRGGWAPGMYHCTCHKCSIRFIGDKRASECADCAYREVEKPAPTVADGNSEPAYPHTGYSGFDYWGFTQRQRAAIDLRVPDSGIPWLDEMIRQSIKNDFVCDVIKTITANDHPFDTSQDETLSEVNQVADALLARIGGAK